MQTNIARNTGPIPLCLMIVSCICVSPLTAPACDVPPPPNCTISCCDPDTGAITEVTEEPCICPSGLIPVGVPDLQVSSDTARIKITDTPAFCSSPSGPTFAFTMRHFNTDTRGRTNRVWAIGYRWCHEYERCIEKEGNTYRLLNASGKGPEFAWNGTNFVDQSQRSYLYGQYFLEFQGPNIVARLKQAGDFSPGRGPGGCPSCGASGGPASPSAPHSAWHACAGFVFEPDGSGTRYRLSTVTAPDGQSLVVNYSAGNAITSIVSAAGSVFSFLYSPSGHVTNIHDIAANRDAKFVYTNDLLGEVTDMAGQTFKFGYDGNGFLTSLKRPNMTGYDQTIISYVGDYSGNTTATITYPQGNQQYAQWDSTDMHSFNGVGSSVSAFETYSWGKTRVETTDPLGRLTSMVFYDNTNSILMGKLKKQVDPDGTFTEYSYDSRGNTTEVKQYDSDSNLISRSRRLYSYFEDTDVPSALTNETLDAASNVLSRGSTEYSRFDNGTATNIWDDVYTLVSQKRWISSNTYSEMRYVYDTNTWLLTEVQQLVSGTDDYRTVTTYAYNAGRQLVSSADALTNQAYFVYDVANRVIAVTNAPNGGTSRVTQYAFDNLDRLTNTVHPDGISESWKQAPCGCGVLSHVDRGGNVTSNSYSANKWLSKVRTWSPNGTLLAYTEYKYNGNQQVTNTIDALTNISASIYNSAGDLSKTIDPLGNVTEYKQDSAGRQYMTIYPDGSTSSNTYDSASRLIKTARISSDLRPLTSDLFSYDPLGRQATTTDALGNVTSNSFDLVGRTVKTTFADGSFSETEYNLLGNTVLQIGPVPAGASQAQKDAATVSNSYDILDRRLTTTDPEGRTNTYEYSTDWPNQTARIKNANNQVVQENWYAPLTGNMTSNSSYGLVMRYAQDALGQGLTTTWPDGSFTTNTYDGARLVRATSRTGNTTSYGFDLAGRTTSVTNSLGAVTTYALNAAGNATNVVDALTNCTRNVFDSMNRLAVTIRPDGSALTNVYDSLGRLAAKTGAGSVPVNYQYDSLGRMTNLVDGEGNSTRFEYNSMGRLIRKTYADGSFYQYKYSARGWLTNRLDPAGKNTAYSYNKAGQLTLADYQTGKDVQYFMDNLGRITQRVDNAGTWSWTYDGESSRVLSESLSAQSASSAVTYSYSPLTYDLASVSCGFHTTQYSWAAGRLTKVLSTGAAFSARYSYLPDSDLLRAATYLDGAVTVHRAYDALSRLTNVSAQSASSAVNSFSYSLDSLGRRTVRQDADGSQTVWKYDGYDQLTNAIRSGSPNGAADAAYKFAYRYDQVGNRLHEDRGQLDLDGNHNNLNQITHLGFDGKLDILGSIGSTNGAYLLVQGKTNAPPFYGTNWLGGAAIHAGSNSIPIVAWSGTNRTEMNRIVYLPPANPQQFFWDPNGNLTNDSQKAYFWDEENRLVAIENLPGIPGVERRRSEYVYDAGSRRIERRDKSSWNGSAYATTNTTRFVWDGWLLLAEADSAGGVTAFHTHGLDLSQSLQGAGGIGGLLCRVQGGTNYLYTADGNGNITHVLNDQGAVVAAYEYDPFGRTVSQSGYYASANIFCQPDNETRGKLK